jgi:four helix bundle protein
VEIKSFEDLEVWQLSKDLTIEVYRITKDFPKDEIFGITNQIKRVALSVPANIAEGFGRFHYLDKVKFYLNARGSLFELKSHLLIALDLKLIDQRVTEDLISNIDRLGVKINNFITATRKKAVKQ